jgi:hypothetical protein
MSITGVHLLLYSPEADALRALVREAFGWPFVEADPGWLIFATPPSELGIHPAESAGHEISLMCDDLDRTVADLRAKGVETKGLPEDRRFGRAVTLVLPGGVEVLLYEPSHASPIGNQAPS